MGTFVDSELIPFFFFFNLSCCLRQLHLCFAFQKRTPKMLKMSFGASLAMF